MKNLLCVPCALFASFFAANAAAQGQSTTTPIIETKASKLVLFEGTEVVLKLAQDVNSRTARAEDLIEFVVAEAVTVRGTAVVDPGSRAIGKVVSSAKPNYNGDPGELTFEITALKAGNTRVPLRGSASKTGDYHLLKRGSQAVFRQGTLLKAYVDADTEIESTTPVPPVTAQNTTAAPREVALDANKLYLPARKVVQLVTLESLSSKSVKPGDRVTLRVLGDVKVEDLVVIANKAPAIGTVTEVKKAGRTWRAGELGIRVDSVTLVNKEQQALELAAAVEGEPTDAAREWGQAIAETQGLAVLLLPFAPLAHGQQATLRRGTVLEAVTHGEVWLDRASIVASQPSPLEEGKGPASVIIYFDKSQGGPIASRCIGQCFVELWCGAVKIGRLRPGRKLNIRLDQGNYLFRNGKTDEGEQLAVKAGEEYYLRILLAGDRSQAFWSLGSVEHDIGEIEALDTIPAQPKDMTDTAGLDTTSLQQQ